ncbi:MAG: ubiquinone/menaquinone biosynthesis C-methylase UbiE [Flavobacteriales bacterium]|jgi:ubiquinone/menaquinone biosynthesis C-methylase UbiE
MEEKAYILGTEEAELHRLGIQHMTWAKEAFDGWEFAGFKNGDALLDLGSGPGFASRDLAYITGNKGSVTAVDLSEKYLKFIHKIAEHHHLNIKTVHTDFNDLTLEKNSLDGAYCRWALAWPEHPEYITQKVIDALKPGACFVAQEYNNWMELHTQPYMPNIQRGLELIFESFKTSGGNINIGARLGQIFEAQGLEVVRMRPLNKCVRPNSIAWNWPKSFMLLYLPKLVESGQFSQSEMEEVVDEFLILENTPGAFFYTPPMMEIIGKKV